MQVKEVMTQGVECVGPECTLLCRWGTWRWKRGMIG
jgi:hypothetical protein